MNKSYDVVKRPIITEKTMLFAQEKKYTFEVAKDTNRSAVKFAIEEIFDVEVKKVYIINQKPRPRRVGKYAGYKRGYKKAIVALTNESREIEIFNT